MPNSIRGVVDKAECGGRPRKCVWPAAGDDELVLKLGRAGGIASSHLRIAAIGALDDTPAVGLPRRVKCHSDCSSGVGGWPLCAKPPPTQRQHGYDAATDNPCSEEGHVLQHLQ